MSDTEKSQAASEQKFSEMVTGKISRRGVLKLTAFAGAGAVAAPLLSATASVAEASTTDATVAANAGIGFQPITPSTADEVVLPPGFSYTVIRKWGDYVVGGEKFGFNSDFNAYFPIDFLQGGNNPNEGLLWNNHEYISQLFISNRPANVNPTFEQLANEKSVVGGSVIHVRKNASGAWEFVDDPAYNRRITAWSLIDLDGPAAGTPEVWGATTVQGTLANCAGGITPWGTALSAEENFQDYGPDAAKGGYGWGKSDTDDRFFNDLHYGWIVEIDPFNKDSRPVKHTALGRFRHENATTVIGKSGHVVVYSGYDKADECVFKFISKGTYNPNDRAANMKLLSEGTLYAADFSKGAWVAVDRATQPKLQAAYKTQAAVLVDAGAAAKLVGATPTDRPEDIKINPADGSVFISFTNNSNHSNYFGQISRLYEAGGDHEALSFTWEVFAVGGPQKGSGFASPDNLIFDNKGNLFVFCDVSSSVAGKSIYTFAGNNGVYCIPTTGPSAGVAFQFASGPIECETTGPCFTPDFKTLFLSVQHPGEESPSLDKLTSHWPEGGTSIPKPALIAITGFK
ncbi:MAG: PhoX family phosphatase [Chloroflexi bacterium]|nr:PhoX family phosphatase [Chloroflexota bacterium]